MNPYNFDNNLYDLNQLSLQSESKQVIPPKIAISPITPSINLSTIVEYFNKFGEVRNWDLQRGSGDSRQSDDFCIVQFKCIEDAQNVLKKRYHRIQKYIIGVEQLTEQYDDSQMAVDVQFLRLNRDQWLKILGYMDVLDLCMVANTCTQLKKFGEQAFSSKFDKITWCAGNKNADDIFTTFGHLISSLEVDIVEPYDVHVDRITSKCTGNLRNLCIWMNAKHCVTLNANAMFGLRSLFSRLHHIEINCHKFFDYSTAIRLFASCSLLESLSINCISNSDSIWNNVNVHFAQLKEIKLQLNKTIDDNGLKILLNCNSGIKKLYIDECPRLTAKAIEIIAHCAPWLEDLTVGPLQNCCPSDLRQLGTLYCLQTLQILLDSALPLLSVIYDAAIAIERLYLWYVNVTEAHIKQVTTMKSLKELTIFSYTTTNYHLELIADHLPMLTKLRLAYSEHVTIDGLAKMLQNASNLTHLYLTNMKHISSADELLHLQVFMDQSDPGKLTIQLDQF